MTNSETSMHLAAPNNERLTTLFTWFDNDRSVTTWGGPDMRLPMTFESMQLDARMDALASRFLLGDLNEALAFGQYYERVGHCHLGRLIVAPGQRGKRLGQALITALVDEGAEALGLSGQSLFVHRHNPGAIRLYERIGFEVATYPESDFDLSGIDYMVRC